MAFKTPPLLLLIIILWPSLFVILLFHERYYFNPKARNSLITTTSSWISRDHPPLSRKVLASKFDFTPFLRHRHRNREHSPDVHKQPEQAGTDVDPRYGVEKRLVPTGPNPLHH
ncbi:hypothetical protein U1Q18_002409 [Sarracenia purpurea var. burkii]